MIAIYTCPYCNSTLETDRPGAEFQTCSRCHRPFGNPESFGYDGDEYRSSIKAAGKMAGEKLDKMIVDLMKEETC